MKARTFNNWGFILSMISMVLLLLASPLSGEEAPSGTSEKVNEEVNAAMEPQVATAESVASEKAEEKAAIPQETPPPTAEESEKGVEVIGAEQEKQAEAPPEESTATTEPGNVTVNFKGADIRTVLAYISEVSGVDIVPSPDVKGVVDLRLTNKPWKVALDIIVRNYGFAYEREGDIIRVITLSKLKEEELSSQVFNLNYSKAKDVVNSVKDLVTDRGKVVYDERTNTILVKDIPTNLYKVGQVITRLDKRTEQVLIEARVIETLLDDTEKLGIDWNIKFAISGASRPITFPFEQFKLPFGKKQTINEFFGRGLTVSPTTSTAGSGGVVATTTAAEFPTAADQGSFGFPFVTKDLFTFGTLDFTQLSAVLELIKSRANTNIVSNPRIATLNNTEALINVGQTLNLPTYERNSTTGKMEITGYQAKELGVILKVTPHINDNGEIVVDLLPQISDLLRYDTLDATSGVVAPVFSIRQAKTQVMIRDGETIFIGGLIKENDVDTRKKLPFIGDVLGDIPYLGYLFTKKETIKQKTELIFFITVNLITADKEIKDMPKANKALIPMYTLTQSEGESAGIKKKIKKKFP